MAQELTKRHPIRGLLWGIVFGLGLALTAIGQGYAALGTLPPLILLIVGIVLGTLWGLFAPSKKPKGEPPRQPVEVEASEASRPSVAAPDSTPAQHDDGRPSVEQRDPAVPIIRTADGDQRNEHEPSLGELASDPTGDPETPDES